MVSPHFRRQGRSEYPWGLPPPIYDDIVHVLAAKNADQRKSRHRHGLSLPASLTMSARYSTPAVHSKAWDIASRRRVYLSYFFKPLITTSLVISELVTKPLAKTSTTSPVSPFNERSISSSSIRVDKLSGISPTWKESVNTGCCLPNHTSSTETVARKGLDYSTWPVIGCNPGSLGQVIARSKHFLLSPHQRHYAAGPLCV